MDNIRRKKIIVLLCILFVLTSNFIFTANSTKIKFEQKFVKSGRNYIIRFNQDSLSSYRKKITRDIIKGSSIIDFKNKIESRINDFKDKIFNFHFKALSDIKEIIGNNFRSNNILKHFTSLFNGIVVKNIPKEKISLIESLSYVKSVSIDQKLELCIDDTVPLINADDVWKLHDYHGSDLKGNGINIGIFDTGIDYNHPDLADNYVGGYDFVNNDSDPYDNNGHGTQCAGIVNAVAPESNIYAFKVLDSKGEGSDSDVMMALEYVLDPNYDGDYSDRLVDIVSMSFGTLNESLTPDSDLCKDIDYAATNGILSVIAAGNDGPSNNTINYPSMARKAICVGATDKSDNIAGFSSRGPVEWEDNVLNKPDALAPGLDIKSTSKNGGYTSGLSGTSFSTPHVAGASALIMQSHPYWSTQDIKKALKDEAVDIGEEINVQGGGRIDVLSAVNLSGNPPIATIDIPKYIDFGKLKISGTAMNGTGNPDDFVNFSLYYKNGKDWIKIFEGENEIKNSVLYTLNTTGFDKGIYKIKLLVRSKDQASFDIKQINIGYKGLIIDCKNSYFEKDIIDVTIFDKDMNPASALVIFLPKFHLPQIKSGSSMQFRAPTIYRPLKENITGKIIALQLFEFKKSIKEIEITNINFSIAS